MFLPPLDFATRRRRLLYSLPPPPIIDSTRLDSVAVRCCCKSFQFRFILFFFYPFFPISQRISISSRDSTTTLPTPPTRIIIIIISFDRRRFCSALLLLKTPSHEQFASVGLSSERPAASVETIFDDAENSKSSPTDCIISQLQLQFLFKFE